MLEPHRGAGLRRLRLGQREHLRSKVDAGDTVAARRQFEAQKPGAAADIERVESGPSGQGEVEDAVPGGALGLGADAMPEIRVEMRRAPTPMRGDLLLDYGGRGHLHLLFFGLPYFSPTTSASASTCSM